MRYILILFLLLAPSVFSQTQFTQEALDDVFLTRDQKEVPFSEILKQYKGKTIFIDIWAGWCGDRRKGMPDVKKLQKKHKNVVFLFLSLDKTPQSWGHAITALNIKGEHYFIASGWKGAFCSSIQLDWIPRYMIVNPEGEITLYKAVKDDDEKIINLLQQVKKAK